MTAASRRGAAGRRGAWALRATRLGDRLQARLAARARVPAGDLRLPEPRLQGDPAAGRRLLEGRLRLGAEPVELGEASPWEVRAPEDELVALHGFGWLDDLAALGGAAARGRAQAWVDDWMRRHGGGTGPGWTPAATAGRLLRLTGHAALLLKGRDARWRDAFARSLSRQALFLARRMRSLPPGPARVEAFAALLQAGLMLPASRELARQAALGLGREAGLAIDAAGATASRSPEELLDVLVLLTGAARAITGADLMADPAPVAAITAAAGRAAPVLRALRHADGGLARFHGGDRGAEGRLDEALAASGRPGLAARAARPPLAMGYARLAAGRVTVIADAALPPQGSASTAAHASALAIEVTSGRRPLIVACGPGRSFGPDWRRAGRATPSHSTLVLDQMSSSRVAPPRPGEPAGRLVAGPSRVVFEPTPLSDGLRVELAHDGWRASHGLTHARTLALAADGRRLVGEDLLTTLTALDARALDRAIDRAQGLGLAVHVRFHLHPEVEAEPLPEGGVALDLRSGERWILTHEGASQIAIEPSAYLEEGAAAPRAAAQVVLATRVLSTSTRLRWTLAKALGTPQALRDLAPSRAEEDE